MTNLISLTNLPDFAYLKKTHHSQKLTAFYQAAISNALPVALWRYPHTADKQALVDFSGRAQPAKINFEHQVPGFAFAPFINANGRATLFIKGTLILNQSGAHLYENAHLPYDIAEGRNRNHFLGRFRELTATNHPPDWDWSAMPIGGEKNDFCTEAEFCDLVEQAIHYINSTDIKKVVASRATKAPLPADFNPIATFENLCNRYPHAFVSLVSIPGLGTWIGATPETLLTLNNSRLETIALAGTQAYPLDIPLEDVGWGAKEIEEQALVSNYIRNFFQQRNLASRFTESGPRTVSAGNIIHLKTDFRVEAKNANPAGANGLRRLGNQILDNLHPTSAVCGMPKKEALSFILEKEQYDREFYSGFLGPVHIDGQSQLFVNLRCMQLTAGGAILYVGAGITRDSVPALEWQETVLKSKTLLSVLET